MESPPATTQNARKSTSTPTAAERANHNSTVNEHTVSVNSTDRAPAAVAFNGRSDIRSHGRSARVAGTSIPLQDRSRQASSRNTPTRPHRGVPARRPLAVQRGNEAPSHAQRITNWIWTKGCALWGWLMSIVMMALTAVTYLVTKMQSGNDSQAAQKQWEILSQMWQNQKDFYLYCKEQKDAADQLANSAPKLTDDCRKALDDGLQAPPPLPHEKRDGQQPRSPAQAPPKSWPGWKYVLEIYEQVKRALREAEKRLVEGIDMLHQDFVNPNVYVGGGAVRRPGW